MIAAWKEKRLIAVSLTSPTFEKIPLRKCKRKEALKCFVQIHFKVCSLQVVFFFNDGKLGSSKRHPNTAVGQIDTLTCVN